MSSRCEIVRLHDLSMSYSEAGRPHLVLESASLEVDEGEIVAILGRSGSGKSTLLNIIAGIDVPTKGEVTVAGATLGDLSDRERTLFRRANIGFVYQFFNLIPTLTVLENVSLPVELTRGSNSSGRPLELLDAVGLADRRDSYPDVLSGGEQQRVAIARALAADPPIVLADEPTGNLDAEVGRSVLEILRDLSRSRGRTLVVATHSGEVAREADRVLRVEDRRLVAGDLESAPEIGGR